MFEQDWDNLNTEQKLVVKNIKDALLVLAPAGTGKTKVIAMRTAYLLQQQISPNSILCLTFTNKAAREMEERIALYEPQHAKNLTIRTFHSFCYYLINQEKQNTRLTFPCTIIDESDTKDILKRILFVLLKQEEKSMGHLIHFIENVKKYRLNFSFYESISEEQLVKAYLKEYPIKDPIILHYGARILRMYQRYLKENNCVDFIDLIIEATYLLEDDVIRQKWQKRYQYIQVDEMQDTSTREYHIIKVLAHKSCVALYGDFNQTIYEWRGSAPQTMVGDYKKTFTPIEITLKTNYRSTQLLLNAANSFIRNSNLYPCISRPYTSDEGELIEVFCGESQEREILKIAHSILQHQPDERKKMAILTRTNYLAQTIYKILEQKGIPCVQVEEIKLMRTTEVKDLLAIMNYAINLRNSYALEKIVKHPMIQMESWLIQALKKTKDGYMYLHDWFLAENNDPYQPLIEGYDSNKIVVLDVESTGLDTTSDDIIQIAAICYGKDGIKKQLDILVKPTQSVGDSYYVHGFTDEQLEKEGLEVSVALDLLEEFIQDKIIVGHNIKYDLAIINSMVYRYHRCPFQYKGIYDTLDLAHKIYPSLPDHKLNTLSEYIHTQTKPNHNALQDILATSEILTHFIEKINDKKDERYSYLESYYPYLQEVKERIQNMTQAILSKPPYEAISYLMNECNYKSIYNKDGLKNLRIFYKIAQQLYEEKLSYEDNYMRLLTFATLHASEVEQSDLFKDKIPVMTIHQAKGLEFDYVYMAGCNEGVFPSRRSVKEGYIEEEKRLFYVGMTRAKKKLYLSYHTGKKMSFLIEEIGEGFKNYRQVALDRV